MINELTEWQKRSINSLRESVFRKSAVKDTTVLAYYFRKPEEFDSMFWKTEFAFLKTFQTQGMLPSVLVVNEASTAIEQFCEEYSIEIQTSPNLIVGSSRSLCIDLVENLHSRFKTQYVLTIQDDGFPMRPGLGDFVGKWDYIGAPWIRHVTYYDFYPYKYCIGNGGFSLRSKRLCEIASRIYKKWFSHLPYWWWLMGDDTFYCKTLRFWFRSAVRELRWPSPEDACRFSIENNDEFLPSEAPLGFHAAGFMKYMMMFPGVCEGGEVR